MIHKNTLIPIMIIFSIFSNIILFSNKKIKYLLNLFGSVISTSVARCGAEAEINHSA